MKIVNYFRGSQNNLNFKSGIQTYKITSLKEHQYNAVAYM